MIHFKILSLVLASFLLSAATASSTHADERPNVIVIMVDDLGFSDIGCYGSEIETPNLDALATSGLRFSQFYNTAKCHSSRVSLLTGQYCIAAGDTSLSHGVTSAEVLGDSGYDTSMVGKWHLKKQPTDFGFQRYWGHLSGACNYFKGDNTFRLGGQPWTVPDKGFYTTVANVDYGLKFLSEAEKTAKPWYLYVAFNAPHAPLQALPEDYAKYEGRYDMGWDTIREQRIEKQRQLGLLADDLAASPRPEHIPAWNTLSDARKKFENKRMTTLAAMIDRVDQEIGRLVTHLKETDQLDNTLIWFVSDNGACPYDRTSGKVDAIPTDGSVMWSDSTAWAWARNSPFRYYKQNQFEGGIASPAIVHWPAGLKTAPGSIHRQPAHLIDVMPTLADLAGADIPKQIQGRTLRPVSGQTLRDVFNGDSIDRAEPLHFQFASDRGLRDGDWKIVSFRSEAWELYNIKNDRSELNDLAKQHPERLQAMVEKWQTMAQEVLHAKGRSIGPVTGKSLPHKHPEWTNFTVDPINGARGNAKQGAANTKAGKTRSSQSRSSIRARKNTTMAIAANELRLTFTGADPGIAIDHLANDLPKGPYTLALELKSEAIGNGEIFFTDDEKTSLPNGTRIPLSVQADGQWHPHAVELKTNKRLTKLRLDVSEGKGTAVLKNLRMLDAKGKEIARWPTSTTAK